ncbi:MAG: NAD-dependent epimerase/dehydratase family protein [Minwuia sp.]|uniref:NAD-dependent epimerase/dehydratase family protein n=1 Tax=Minwuia sp. TaxID=2493630 RepID=UPI003A8672BE
MAHWLVTGGCGFIGSHLSDALVARGDAVTIVDDLSTGNRDNPPAEAEIVVGDIRDADLMERLMEGKDGCFHLAAVASVQKCTEEWADSHKVNLTGTINVFDAAKKAGRKPVVYASSAAVYGDNPNVPLTEDAETKPLSAYGADKLGCELHGRVAHGVHGVPNTGFRFFNVFGPRQDPKSPYSGVIAIFTDRIRAGQGITIFGDGGQVRDFVYVGDVVRHLIAAMDAGGGRGDVYNVCTGKQTSVLELAHTVAEICGTKAGITHAEARAGDIRTSIGNPSKATAAFGVPAEMAFRDGLKLTLG